MTMHRILRNARWLAAFLLVVASVGCSGGGPVAGDVDELPEAFKVLTPEIVATAVELRESALRDSDAHAFLRDLTTEVGPRSAGSDGDWRAVVWARERLGEMGLENVRIEPVTVPRWERGKAAGRILSPFPQRVVLAALGGSVGTPEGGIEAEVVEVASLEALEALEPSAVEGKIVFFNRRMRRARDGSGYGEAVPVRTRGAAKAGAKGAAAVLIRSIGTSSERFAHTGTTRYEADSPRIPAAALSNPDADLLAAQLAARAAEVAAGGEGVRFHLELGCRDLGEAESANVIGEVVGREKPEEVVLLAAHLDSWDLGTGAIDDGLGCSIVAETARWIRRLPQPPRRTIRVLLTANEEFGLSGARAYALAHDAELPRHVLGIESDFGLGRVWALRSRVEEPALGLVRDLVRLVAPLGVEYQGNTARGGADLSPLEPSRLPLIDLPLEGERYFDYHHTANDTFDKVDAEAMKQNVAAFAAVVYSVAEYAGDLGRAPEPVSDR